MHWILGIITFLLLVSLVFHYVMHVWSKALQNGLSLSHEKPVRKGNSFAEWWIFNLVLMCWLHILLIITLIIVNVCV